MYDDETYEDIPYAPISTKWSKDVFFTGNWRTMRPVLDVKKCINCNTCWKFCPDVAIILGDTHVTVNYDYCKGCGICAHECPVKAFTMVKEVDATRQAAKDSQNAQGGDRNLKADKTANCHHSPEPGDGAEGFA